jgi:hypothetical protein
LPFPETDVGAFSGSAVVVKNTQNYLGSGHPRPFAILGVGIGTSAGGVYGWTTNTNGIGVHGLNTDTGFGGLFSLTGASPTAGSSALAAVNSGGSKSATDDYGTAGLFQITNAQNSAPALEATTAGPSEAGYFEINSIEGNDNSTARGIEPTPTNPNSAALVAINNNSGGFNCPSFAPGSGGCWGQAGYFSINNTSNQSDALFAQTATPHGTAVHGYVGPQFPTAEVSWTTAFGIYG